MLYHIYVFFNDTATTEIYTLSLHDALPILPPDAFEVEQAFIAYVVHDEADLIDVPGQHDLHRCVWVEHGGQDRKSTRLNSSHANISYAVFCLKKKTTLLRFELRFAEVEI